MAYLDCSKIILELQSKLKATITKHNLQPNLLIIRVGNKAADISYQNSIVKVLTSLEIKCQIKEYEDTITNEQFINEFINFNNDNTIDTIIVLSPLPKQLDIHEIAKIIKPSKDVDGFVYQTMIPLDNSHFAPCTPSAIMYLLDYFKVELTKANIVIIGAGKVVGQPLSFMLLNRNATISICNKHTPDISIFSKQADILISAAGVPNLIKTQLLKPASMVIDVGISLDKNKIVGDVSSDVANYVDKLIPSIDGTGILTTYILAENIIKAKLSQLNINN